MTTRVEPFLSSDDPGPVTQPWTWKLTFMQQSVLIAAVRGPDGIAKDHVSKLLCRWLRRCFLISAFDGGVLREPFDDLGHPRGGSFTGPSIQPPTESEGWLRPLNEVLDAYLRTVDELPHHFQLHLLHAAEILGYEHPELEIRAWWRQCYLRLVNDLHLQPETIEMMRKRLGDREVDWRAAEEVTARGPTGEEM